jgi:hypothetical protein
MATENDFNTYLSTHVRRMGTDYKAVKISDKIKTGIADFLFFHDGRAVAAECKLMQALPEGKRRALKHTVSGPQQTFLKSMALAGVPGFVLIACTAERNITVVPGEAVPTSGNWTKEEILAARVSFGVYAYMDIPLLIKDLFGDRSWVKSAG